MKSYAQICKDLDDLRAVLKERHDKLEALEMDESTWKETRATRESLRQEIDFLQIQQKSMESNRDHAMAQELRPALLDVLSQYNGKPYGPKTAEKIQEALKERTGLFVWLSWGRYGDYCIIKARPRDRSWSAVPEIELRTRAGAGKGLTSDNKIHNVDGDPLELCGHRDYVESPPTRALEILTAYERAKAAAAALTKAHDELQALLPASMEAPFYAHLQKTTLF